MKDDRAGIVSGKGKKAGPRRGLSRRTRVGVVYGGLSSEREISLRTGRAVIAALRGRGYQPVGIDAARDLPGQLTKKKIQVVFNALHGRLGEDGSVQGLLETLGIPYTGAGVLASALGMDKYLSRLLFTSSGLTAPRFVLIEKGKRFSPQHVERELGGYPLMVKPRCEGSSVGVEKVRNRKQLAAAVAGAMRYGDDALVESFIPGTEVHVGVLDGKSLGEVEVVPREDFYSYRAKYTAGRTDYILPARISARERRLVHRAAELACRVIRCEGIPRVDFILFRGRPYVLEINTLPGLTETSLIPKIADSAGMDYSALIERILRTASVKIPVAGPNRRGK